MGRSRGRRKEENKQRDRDRERQTDRPIARMNPHILCLTSIVLLYIV
jgi:hypothetical protein